MSSTLALRAVTSLQVLWSHGRDTYLARIESRDREEGLTTLEIVVWTVGLFAIAGLAVAAIKASVDKHMAPIK